MFDEKILKSGEVAVWRLRSLYKQYGYLPFKMSKFEEYDLYVRNKDFLQGNGVITFSDTDEVLEGTVTELSNITSVNSTGSVVRNVKISIHIQYRYCSNLYNITDDII